MDTVELRLNLKDNVTLMVLDFLKVDIVALKSPFGHSFCDLIEVFRGRRDRGLIIKISYPRYYYGNNAYLVTSKSKCLEVQEYFVNFIQEDTMFKEIVSDIQLTRVDIPFTYYMRKGLDFNSYSNIFRILALVYNEKKGASAKGYENLVVGKYETVIYSDNGKTDKSSNNRLMIYNQYQNLKTKLREENFENTLKDYPDLKSRMRLEVAKRIRRKEFSLDEFKNFDILSEYFQSYKKYILDNVLDKEIIDKIYTEKAIELAELLKEEREASDFKYEVFILKYYDNIYDYKILRKALEIAIPNDKTRERAITRVRKVLIESEEREEVTIMDIYSVLCKIRSCIKELEIDD